MLTAIICLSLLSVVLVIWCCLLQGTVLELQEWQGQAHTLIEQLRKAVSLLGQQSR